MVTWVYVSVMFDDGVSSADLCIDAGSRHYIAMIGQGCVKEIYEIPPNVIANPVVEDVTHELSESDR